ncbi:MAG: hypothetical protein PHF05_06760 [Candidatus Izemoplasmatales bacterium]|nr:hypothetical protein [Candidatus Izemoplasmatales bacterium]
MEQFSQWYIEFFKKYLKDVVEIIFRFFDSVVDIFVRNPLEYYKDFVLASNTFNFFDWVMAILAMIITLILFFAFFILLFQLLRRYFRFVKIEREKTDLLYEVGSLNSKIMTLVDEKNAVVALSGNKKNIGTKSNGTVVKGSVQDPKNRMSRFVKLVQVDEKYKFTRLNFEMKPEDKISLSEMVKRFVNYSASQLNLYYTEKTVATFIAGMATSKTMILEGISGTGKTSLPYAFGKFFQHDSDIISVQPSWRDRFEMMGYLNEFTKRFSETDFLRAIYEATYRNDVTFIVLDEMNLARVEYYFADFLSLLEMPSPSEWLLDIVPDFKVGDPMHLDNGKLLIPENIWFIGTANKDDSTFTITDKVYDRSASIEMNNKAIPFSAPHTEPIRVTDQYLKEKFSQALRENMISQKTMDNLIKLDNFITQKFEITFGNRIMKQIMVFLPTYMSCGGNELEGLDYLVSRKIIRKFEALNLPFLQDELQELLTVIDRLFGRQSFEDSRKMIQKFMKQL